MHPSLRPFLIAFTAAAVTLTFGCSSSPDDPALADGADQEANRATKLVEAKLYDNPQEQPNASCDRHTLLTVSKGRNGVITAKLENKLSGSCEIFVPPNPRSFVVTESSSCGSKVYEGSQGGNAIRVQDNRTRLCEDLRPAPIEVTETTDGQPHEMFGKPLASSAPGGNNGGGATSSVLGVKLYTEPHATPSPGCDRYLKLTIGREGSKLVAHLKQELSPTSGCEIFVVPDERSYDVTQSESCGSKVYEGLRGADKLHVQDNRTRLCEDLRPDTIEVTETRGAGEVAYFGAP